MNVDTALGWMAVSVLNDHYPHPDDDHDEDDPLGGCCVINCGPCGALKWFHDNNRADLERHLKTTGFHIGGWSHWDDATDSLRWDWFHAYWARHKSCGSSNGVLTGCDFSQESDDA